MGPNAKKWTRWLAAASCVVWLGAVARTDAPEPQATTAPTKPWAELEKVAAEHPDEQVRFEALKELFKRRSEGQLQPVLMKALGDQAVRVRAIALELLEEADALPPMEKLVSIATTDPNPHMRVHAYLLMVEVNLREAEPHLKHGVEADPDSYVRKQLEGMLEDLGLRPVDAKRQAESIANYRKHLDGHPEDLQKLKNLAADGSNPETQRRYQDLLRKLGYALPPSQ
jgi:HEAT repeat protein